MAENNTPINTIVSFISVLAIAIFTIILIYLPFTSYEYTYLSDVYIYKTFYFGYWTHFKNGELWADGGASLLTNFQIASPILIIIALVLSFITLPSLALSLTKADNYFNKHRRSFGVAFTFNGLIGLIGILVNLGFINYLKETQYGTNLGAGFIVAIIIFCIYILVGITAAVYPRKWSMEPSNLVEYEY